jgi:bacterial/archaeal transporter family-2 protein
MWGIIFSIIAGISMSLQGVFNTRLGEKIGIWQTNNFVQGTAFAITIAILLFTKNGNYKVIKDANKLYLLGGVLGVVIIFTVMRGIKDLGPTYAIATILVAQLASAALIDAIGLFDTPVMKFGFTKIAGIIIMILGIVVFKWKG